MTTISYLEAIVVGALQGVTELFPVSSLGHSVILPALIGGSWGRDLDVSTPESPYLAFIVGLHVATAFALLAFFWRDWIRIIGGFVTSIRYRRISTDAERLAWLIVLATIPVGVAGLLLEHTFRTVLGRPMPAAAFLFANGIVLFVGELLRRRAPAVTVGATAGLAKGEADRAESLTRGTDLDAGLEEHEADLRSDSRLAGLTMKRGVLIGCAQILALLPGISRSGATMVAGLTQGLSHRDAARFSFLLATPVILAAGVLKVPDLFGPLGAGIHGQILAGSIASFVCAYLAVRFLEKYFRTRTLIPFAIYCLAAGAVSFVVLAAR
ncbi:undecaprenyl-diphosphatase [Nakamurella sp. UYEF19]|uniref:undecaprenyl-diphosphate phosphatase n=1 Tax=Nakamurella sp. UYEF19 TaxID=1756392 RepID=UPI00339885C7